MNKIEKKSELMTYLKKYEHWKYNGSLKHGYNFNEKLIYDNYRNHISHIEGNLYKFSFQLFDSPNFNIWWFGEFKTVEDDIEIIKDNWEWR